MITRESPRVGVRELCEWARDAYAAVPTNLKRTRAAEAEGERFDAGVPTYDFVMGVEGRMQRDRSASGKHARRIVDEMFKYLFGADIGARNRAPIEGIHLLYALPKGDLCVAVTTTTRERAADKWPSAEQRVLYKAKETGRHHVFVPVTFEMTDTEIITMCARLHRREHLIVIQNAEATETTLRQLLKELS